MFLILIIEVCMLLAVQQKLIQPSISCLKGHQALLEPIFLGNDLRANAYKNAQCLLD